MPASLPRWGSVCRNRNQGNAIYCADDPAAQPGCINSGLTTGERGGMVEKIHRRLTLTYPSAGIARIGEAVTKDHQAGGPVGLGGRPARCSSRIIALLARREHC